MTEYAAPLDDMAFVLAQVVDYPELATFEPFGHADLATVRSILDECGRFMAEVVAPLNRTGDTVGSRHNADGSVTTPPGFPQAYRRYVDAGWS
jgi:hypothetical protein